MKYDYIWVTVYGLYLDYINKLLHELQLNIFYNYIIMHVLLHGKQDINEIFF